MERRLHVPEKYVALAAHYPRVYHNSMNNRGNPAEEISLQYADIADFARDASRRTTQFEETKLSRPFYHVALGLVPLKLGSVEFRILRFLASKPYHPFSPRGIAAAATTTRFPVSEEDVSQHIASLREQLGHFRDYVQTVPYMGYRFKA